MEPKTITPVRVHVGEDDYSLRPWGSEESIGWLFDILKAIGAALGNHPSQLAAVMAVIHGLDRATFLAFRKAVLKYTDLVTPDPSGRERVQNLATVAEVHLQRKPTQLVQLMIEHVKLEFLPFFVDLPALLDAGKEGAPSQSLPT